MKALKVIILFDYTPTVFCTIVKDQRMNVTVRRKTIKKKKLMLKYESFVAYFSNRIKNRNTHFTLNSKHECECGQLFVCLRWMALS